MASFTSYADRLARLSASGRAIRRTVQTGDPSYALRPGAQHRGGADVGPWGRLADYLGEVVVRAVRLPQIVH
jgi:hypothetical protein